MIRMQRESGLGNICRYIPKCKIEHYDQCYNHSHILCEQFKTYYEINPDRYMESR